ncbi:MAG: hypothetical protein IT258_14035 [Saprospiraceae bacterium]|nr:hypothetical protein [Saprospiraceae bacterium]
MKLFLIASLAFPMLFLLGCHCDDDANGADTLQHFLDCDPSQYEITSFAYCHERQVDSALYCDFIYNGTAMLRATSKKDLRYGCSEIKQVVFEDSLGNTLVYEKDAGVGISSLAFSSLACDSLSNLTIFSCGEREKMWANLKSDAQSMEFNINIEARDGAEFEPFLDFDLLTIWMGGVAPNPNAYRSVLSYRIYEDSSRGASLHYDFAESLELNGKVYESVFYAKPSNDSTVDMEIYFTKDLGIIAFRDMDGKAWYFKEFR